MPLLSCNQSLLHFHWQNLHQCCYMYPYLPFFWYLPFLLNSIPYRSHLIFAVKKFCIIQINAIFVIITVTNLTQARKISFVNTILFRSHNHYLINFWGTWYGLINSRRWERWLRRLNIILNKKNIKISNFIVSHPPTLQQSASWLHFINNLSNSYYSLDFISPCISPNHFKQLQRGLTTNLWRTPITKKAISDATAYAFSFSYIIHI